MDMNKGYHGWSMSERAYRAYAEGEMPRSKWTKKAMVAAMEGWAEENDRVVDSAVLDMTKSEMFENALEWSSWHHTSRMCNPTDFYQLDEGWLFENSRDMTAEELAARDAANAAERAELKAQQKAMRELMDAEDAYQEAHGHGPDTVAAYIEEHPDKVLGRRTSKKGTELVEVSLPCGTVEMPVWQAERSRVSGGWSAVEEGR